MNFDEQKEKNVIICGASSYLEDRVRLYKLKKVMDSKGIQYELWGWRRSYSKELKLNYRVLYLARGGTGKFVPFVYLWWMNRLFWRLLFLKSKKHQIVYSVGFEASFPAYLVSYIRRLNYVFDNPDNIYLSHPLPTWAVTILKKLEKKIAIRAKKHILPSKSRWNYEIGNEFYIPNTPLKEDLDDARKIVYSPFKKNSNEQLVIYITGRLVDVRGLELLKYAIQHTDRDSFCWVIAGYVDENLISFFQEFPNVSYLGMISSTESLALYYQSDLLFAFYDPALPINRIAESNKWWDCVATGVPFISNYDIVNLKVFEEANACFLIKYDNKCALVDLLKRLYSDRDELSHVRQNLQKIAYTSWDKIIEVF